ncbi:FHA domain-containing protein [Ottowia sp.]|uniref:FHA domain-containing protein n=1 Tax=Ottowia sp. TaxID=1898956 RepID=UPI003A8B4503
MTAPITIVFIDLTGSTAAYEALGNEQAAGAILKITQWVGRVCEAHGGRTIKYLGDGVLASFDAGMQAVEAVVFMQQNHTERMQDWPEPLRMGLKIGMAAGNVVEMASDTYGDSVNLAARLSDMAGPFVIWADESVVQQLGPRPGGAGMAQSEALAGVRFRSLGAVRVRGMVQTPSVFQIEWNKDLATQLLTMPGELLENMPAYGNDASIALAWLGSSAVFAASDMPILIGRIPDCGFVVSDQRVSRQHVRLEWVDGAFVLTDLSSFGCWVRFQDDVGTELHLRRSQCILHATGEVALGAPFSDFSAPVMAFNVLNMSGTAEHASATPSLFDDMGGL